MNIKTFLPILTIITGSVIAMDNSQLNHNTYNKTVIDSTSIYALSDKLSPEAASVVNNWADKNKNMLQTIVPEAAKVNLTRDPVLSEIKTSKELLQKNGYTNLGNCSYIFELPKLSDKKYFVQMAGPILKRRILGTYNGLGWHNMNELTETSKRTNTFQTVSRAANYLRCKEKINELAQNGKVYFKVPPTHLVQIPGRPKIETATYDDNCFVLQESVDNVIKLREAKILNNNNEEIGLIVSKKIEEVTPKSIEHAVAVMLHAGLWDIKANLMLDEKDASFVVSDLEQPMDDNPDHFYHKDSGIYWRNTRVGIQELAELLQAGLNQGLDIKPSCVKLRELIEKDPEVQNSCQAQWFNQYTTFKYE